MTLTEMITLRAEYRVALSKVLKKQSYLIGTRELTYANLSHIQSELKKLDIAIKAKSGGGTIRVRRVIMRDD